eukprot:2049833-Prymnesium_polylepis.1
MQLGVSEFLRVGCGEPAPAVAESTEPRCNLLVNEQRRPDGEAPLEPAESTDPPRRVRCKPVTEPRRDPGARTLSAEPSRLG